MKGGCGGGEPVEEKGISSGESGCLYDFLFSSSFQVFLSLLSIIRSLSHLQSHSFFFALFLRYS